MNFYKGLIVAFGLWPPENIVNSYHSATALAFTFDKVSGATGYEYTTDGGKTYKSIVSGQNFTTDSAGNDLVVNTQYWVQIRSKNDKDKSAWSTPVLGFTSSAVIPTGKTLPYILSGEGVYLRAGIVDDGGAVCQVCLELDGVNTAWIDNLYTGAIIKQFVKIDYLTSHKYRAVIKNMAGTMYGDYITIPPLHYFDYRVRVYDVV